MMSKSSDGSEVNVMRSLFLVFVLRFDSETTEDMAKASSEL